ncbi:MAG: hypothetical protein ACQERR_07085 [Pseudomonadota bacterium]
MKPERFGKRFFTGNVLLALGLISLFFMGPLSEAIGFWAVILWMVLAAVGVYLIMTDEGQGPGMPG